MTVLYALLLNTKFYIFIFLFILYQIISYKQDQKLPDNLSFSKLLIKLESYRINNIYYSFFMILFFICFYIIIFIYLRIKNLGLETETYVISQIALNYTTITTIFFTLMSISYYVMILNSLCYKHIIGLHFYFIPNKVYDKILDIERVSPHISTVLSNIFFFFYIKTLSETEYKELPHIKYDFLEGNFSPYNDKIWVLVNKYRFLSYLFKILAWIFNKLSTRIDRVLYYMPYSILILVIMYDIFQGIFYYTYYMLLYIFIMNIIRKIRYFLHVKDPLYDYQIQQYLYLHNDIISYKQMQQYIEETKDSVILDLEKLEEKLDGIRRFQEEIINYINHDYKVYYIIDPVRANNEIYLNNNYKRFHIIILMFLSIIYFIYNQNKYCLEIMNNKINIWLFMIPLFIIIVIVHNKILCLIDDPTNNSHWIENNRYKIIYRILTGILIIAILYIMLKNKLTMMPNETILEIKDYIMLKESFTIEEKIRYVQQYLKYLQMTIEINKEKADYVIAEIIKTINNQENILLQEIRIKIETLIKSEKPQIDVITVQSIFRIVIDKIKQWIT